MKTMGFSKPTGVEEGQSGSVSKKSHHDSLLDALGIFRKKMRPWGKYSRNRVIDVAINEMGLTRI